MLCYLKSISNNNYEPISQFSIYILSFMYLLDFNKKKTTILQVFSNNHKFIIFVSYTQQLYQNTFTLIFL